MTLIGVTGSFCTGKTTVCNYFKALGVYIIDADKIVHELYKKDRRVVGVIRKNFGKEVFNHGKVDRAKLGGVVFKKPKSLKRLQDIIHPKVIKRIKEEIKKMKKDTAVIDAPLLIEAGLNKIVDFVIVVNTDRRTQIERAERRGFTKRNCAIRRNSQIPLQKKIKYADFVIDNNRSKEYTKRQVMKIWNELEVKHG